MFEDLEEVAEKNMEVQDQLSKVKEEHQSKLLEREEAEAECQEVSDIRACPTVLAQKFTILTRIPCNQNETCRWKLK